MTLRNRVLAPVGAILAYFMLAGAPNTAEAAWRYQVRKGQYLGRIATQFRGVSDDEIATHNGLKSKHNIREGQILAIPNHKVKVKQGDSLWKIASRYGPGVTHASIKAANNLKSDIIHPDQELSIPSSNVVINQKHEAKKKTQTRTPTVRKTTPKTITTVVSSPTFANYINANQSKVLKDGTYWVDGPNFVTLGDYNHNGRSPARASRVLPQTQHLVQKAADYTRSKGYGDLYVETNPGSKHRRKGSHAKGLGADFTLLKDGKKVQFTKSNRYIMDDMCQWLMQHKDELNIASVIAYPGAPHATHRNKHHYDHIHITLKGNK
ncbi:MAG: LysM peptidoglycan-binding domain-containing protein [Candidatus Woesearchaeota archaeon]|jgi:LysM repeat protein|nr:LysM peptidoglycan-binding domain-containing protein [Candidatus Woesearchaeota archaeon]